MEIQQSGLFIQYIKNLGWNTEKIGSYTLFIKSFFWVGAIAKLQRTTSLPNYKTLLSIIKKYHVKLLIVEPDSKITSKELSLWTTHLASYVRISSAHYLSTKTIRVDLSPHEDDIFQSFTEAKRRAVRRAASLGVTMRESLNINEFLKLKAKTAGFLGGVTTYGIKELWPYFSPKNATILLAQNSNQQIVGGVLLLYWNKIAYYWIAGATKEGKKLFAPTLLVWASLQAAKKHGCTLFDFVGVWDERLPKENGAWKGFTKFKEGFGGNELYYPILTR